LIVAAKQSAKHALRFRFGAHYDNGMAREALRKREHQENSVEPGEAEDDPRNRARGAFQRAAGLSWRSSSVISSSFLGNTLRRPAISLLRWTGSEYTASPSGFNTRRSSREAASRVSVR